jgi:hypothetical protein
MWNLSGDDVQRAIEELKGRRAAIQARYDDEMKKLEADLADLESFERVAMKIASDYLGEARSSALAAGPAPAAENVALATPSEQGSSTSPDTPVERSAEAEPAAGSEAAGAPRNSSRWRMRLGTGEAPR